MQWFKFTIIKLTLFLVLGILLGYFFDVSLTLSFILNLISVLCLTLLFISNRFGFKLKTLFGLLTYLTFICIGLLAVCIHNPMNHQDHYSNLFKSELNSDQAITFKVKEVLKSGNYYDKYIIDFKNINDKKVTGKSLLNVQKDSTQKSLRIDDIVFSKTIIKDLIPPLNPHQFNYKEYLKKQYIYHQIFLKNDELMVINQSNRSIYGFASKLRETINQKLKPYNFKPDELAIINALLLGQRQDISEETYNNYTNAGAIHILAVSGLHIGIILLILNFLFKPIEGFKHGLYIKTIIIIFLLWSFAIVAGLSPSVMRAVTMFSVVAIGLNFKRATNIYN
ncbi:MAG: ComEC family competence protein, partial [Aureibaculum sp.]